MNRRQFIRRLAAVTAGAVVFAQLPELVSDTPSATTEVGVAVEFTPAAWANPVLRQAGYDGARKALERAGATDIGFETEHFPRERKVMLYGFGKRA